MFPRCSRSAVRLILAFVVVALGATACSSSEPEETSEEQGPGIEAEATKTAEQIEAEATAEAQGATPAFEGEIIDRRTFQPGDCFNDYKWFDRVANPQEATTRVDCDKPHEGQVYFADVYPALDDQPYVGEPELRAYTQDLCYENFADWVGMAYEESKLEIGLVIPDLTSWVTPPFAREISCYVTPYGGGLLRGSMEDIGL